MTFMTRMQTGVLALLCTAAIASQAAAAQPQALSPTDVQAYKAAFAAADQGDFIAAEIKTAEVQDKTLLGHLSLHRLMHPVTKSSFADLKAWLSRYADIPGADRIFALARRRSPAEAAALPTPVVAAQAEAPRARAGAPSEAGRQAKDAFYSGDLKRALTLAGAGGDRWIAGLSAYRLKDYAQSEGFFGRLARDDAEDPWLRAGAGYWASRAATALGDTALAKDYLALAARHSQTFYGMIAQRQVQLAEAKASEVAAQGELTPASYIGPTVELAKFVRDEPRAHRAVALTQIGRAGEAAQELRAGLTLARTDAERGQWMSLIMALNPALATIAKPEAETVNLADYPLPTLEPKWGFTIDKALVYAIVRQESRFNPAAVSPAGAVGLMQLMPEAAARAAGDDKLKADMSPLFDPAFNLRVGQDYVTWLMERGVGHDILRTVAAYNGGPGTLQKTAQMVGEDADSLMVIECLPALETRNYVEKVMAAYWTYRKMFGQPSKTLDALALGEKSADARLDR